MVFFVSYRHIGMAVKFAPGMEGILQHDLEEYIKVNLRDAEYTYKVRRKDGHSQGGVSDKAIGNTVVDQYRSFF